MADITEIAPLELHETLAWIGGLKNWMVYQPSEQGTNLDGSGQMLPITNTTVDWKMLSVEAGTNQNRRKFVDNLYKICKKANDSLSLGWALATGTFFAQGPKLFHPTQEQFESMEHVELSIPPKDFRMPFPALAIAIPKACKKSIADATGVPVAGMPNLILVFQSINPVNGVSTNMTVTRYVKSEQITLFTEHPLNATIEEAITRRVRVLGGGLNGEPIVSVGWADEIEPEKARCQELLTRAAINLCLMMTHYGCHVTGPVDPVAYKKHRARKDLARFKYGDFLSVQMKQDVTIRRVEASPFATVGCGTGVEVKPHWRKGHWRAMPGHGERRSKGETVPMTFVRPCLVRPDRVSGDLSQSQATYHG